jgi:hypothetical protein
LQVGAGGYQFPRGASSPGYWFMDNVRSELDVPGRLVG